MSLPRVKDSQGVLSWLDFLCAVFPPRASLLVGAGAGNGLLVQWLEGSHKNPVCLVEADEQQYQHLVTTVRPGSARTVKMSLVAGESANVKFHCASNPSESSLIPPEDLLGVWPNLLVREVKEAEAAVTLDSLADDYGHDVNWLMLDCLPAATLLRGGGALLERSDVVIIRVVLDECSAVPEEATADAARHLLEQFGFRLAFQVEERNPSLVKAVFVRDVGALTGEIRRLEARQQHETPESESDTEEGVGPRTAVPEQRLALSPETRDENAAQVRLDARSKNTAQDSASAEAERHESKVEHEVLAQGTSDLESLMECCDDKLKELVRAFEHSVERQLGNAVKQVEAYTSLQGYLATGELMPILHGWPISPDFALLLVQLLEQQSFDAIIEFGSGSSTLVVARALAHLANRHPTRRQPVQLAFEHLEEYYDNTAALLARAGLRDCVQLVLAPLTQTEVASGESYSYYEPGDSLTRLAKQLGDIGVPRILAIVDGPPETVGPLARYPALEMLIGAIPQHSGFLLMDDYRRPGEQEIKRRWLQLLEGRGIEATVTEYPLEKMAVLICYETCMPLP